jgi:hypothetical protein
MKPLAAFLAIVLAGSAVEPAPRGEAQPVFAALPQPGSPAVEPHRGASVPATSLAADAPTGAIGSVLLGGTLSYVDAKYGPEYLALPFPRGTVAEICGPGDCVTRRSTDYGPDQRVHPGRIADLSAADFVRVCGVPLSAGLCRGTVELEPPVNEADDRMRQEDAGPTLPPTDSEEDPA